MKTFDESLRYEYPGVTPDDIVFDGGCYEGRWTNAMHERYGCHVLALEPVPAFFDRCAKRFEGNPKIRVRNVALGDHCGSVSVGIQGDSSGLYCGSADRANNVKMITLAWLFTYIDQKEVAVLKLNVEGSEFAILEHMLANGYADRFRHIQFQPHRIVPNAEERLESILTGLAKTHEVTSQAEWCWYLLSRR